MSEWWTYRPSDFLMFAPRTYWRLFELHNAQWWPLQALLSLAALACVAWAVRRGAPGLRAGVAGLAVVWAFVAASFLLQRYAQVNWAASAFAGVFLLQAGGLAVLATRGDLRAASGAPRRAVGTLLLAWALGGHPLLAFASGRPWTQAEVFGIAPDPTAIATLGWLLWNDAATRSTRLLLGALRSVPIAWCAVSAATLWTMDAAQAWVSLIAGAAAAVALTDGERPAGRTPASL